MFEEFRELTEEEVKVLKYYAKYYDKYSDTTYYSRLENNEKVIKQHVEHIFISRQQWHDELLKIYKSKDSFDCKRKALWELSDRSSTDYANKENQFIVETSLEITNLSRLQGFLKESGIFLYKKIESKSIG